MSNVIRHTKTKDVLFRVGLQTKTLAHCMSNVCLSGLQFCHQSELSEFVFTLYIILTQAAYNIISIYNLYIIIFILII